MKIIGLVIMTISLSVMIVVALILIIPIILAGDLFIKLFALLGLLALIGTFLYVVGI